MNFITTDRLGELLLSHKGAEFVRLVTSTEPKMNVKHRDTKAPNPFLGRSVKRMAQRHGMLGAGYENAVRNRREREEHADPKGFTAESLWNGAGEHVDGSKTLVRHRGTGKLYMVFYPHREGSVMADIWTVDGCEVSVDELKPFLPPVSGSKRQETEEQVQWRVIGLDSIREVQMGGEIYTIAA